MQRARVYLPRVHSKFFSFEIGHFYLTERLMLALVTPIIKNKAEQGNYSIPYITLDSVPLNKVARFKYLGHWIAEVLNENMDDDRERRSLAIQGNMLVRRSAHCTKEVNVTIFKA
ncbi:hypothetical protein EVAR_29141_1 [Eumeta japonica]|uniref:Uncharacterized protein n=1 Tax=Eumeta variegata TaxID=151549 RepID=A0A4C1VBL0_EUMVA|nr:hypothetical protein EVAR_29141_1 [Eumeta japonica]